MCCCINIFYLLSLAQAECHVAPIWLFRVLCSYIIITCSRIELNRANILSGLHSYVNVSVLNQRDMQYSLTLIYYNIRSVRTYVRTTCWKVLFNMEIRESDKPRLLQVGCKVGYGSPFKCNESFNICCIFQMKSEIFLNIDSCCLSAQYM